MRQNKCEIISVIGIMAAILLFAMDSALALYDLGSGHAIHGNAYFERFPFNWETIDEWGRWQFCIMTGWFALLIIPWIQYFNAVRLEGRFGKTLAEFKDEPLFSVFFTVFNIALVIGCTLWFIETGEPDEKGLVLEYDEWWRDLLRIYVVFSSPFYILSSIAAISVNHIKKRGSSKSSGKPIPVWHWVVSAIPFLLLALSVADARWDFFSFL
ncbi:MAG: hypothetical protein IKT59_02940 [Bacteroidales bacterium]|nr:hypothetical protein [Bacteroidales bacterium]